MWHVNTFHSCLSVGHVILNCIPKEFRRDGKHAVIDKPCVREWPGGGGEGQGDAIFHTCAVHRADQLPFIKRMLSTETVDSSNISVDSHIICEVMTRWKAVIFG